MNVIEKIGDGIIKVVQMITYPFAHFYFRLFYKTKVDVRMKFDKDERYIFAPNHQKYIDPFITFYSLSFRDVYPLLPLRFMTTPVYMRKWFIGGFLKMFGCYDSKHDSLKKSVEFLKRGNTVCIFPQGKFDKEHKSKVKVGVVYVQKKVKGSVIVPVNINYGDDSARIVFVKKILNKKFGKNLQPLADKVLKAIKEKK